MNLTACGLVATGLDDANAISDFIASDKLRDEMCHTALVEAFAYWMSGPRDKYADEGLLVSIRRLASRVEDEAADAAVKATEYDAGMAREA